MKRRRGYETLTKESPPAAAPPNRREYATKSEALSALEPGWKYGPDNPITIRGEEVYALYRQV